MNEKSSEQANAQLVSRNELLAQGWTERQISLALDEADQYGPSTHWLNPYGEPLYDGDRVNVAARRLELSGSSTFSADEVKRWNRDGRPTCLPVFSFHFHRFAAAYVPGSEAGLWRERLSHPVMGRIGGSNVREAELIKKVLCVLLTEDTGIAVKAWEAGNQLLIERVDSATQRLGAPWPDVLCRAAKRTTHLSSATGSKNLRRMLDSLALLGAGRIAVPGHDIEPLDVVRLLIWSPAIRFDPIMTAGC